MPEDSTAVTSREAVEAARGHEAESFGPPCLGCGLRNLRARRSCLACGAPLGSNDELAGPLPIDPPMLEREHETHALAAVVDRFVGGQQGGLVVVSAPRGTGTTRLLRYVAEQLLESNAVRILTTTVREADGPYAPVTRLLWERFGVTPMKGPQTARLEIVAEVNRVLASRAGPPTEHARRIVIAAGLPADGAGRWESEAARAMPRIADSVARFLQADADAQPTAILIDNLDAAPEEGLALFLAIARALGKSRILTVVAGGAALVDRLGDTPRTLIKPHPISSEACAALCHHLLPALPSIPSELVEAVVRRSGGLPGHVREILLTLIESQVIVADDVPWRVDLDALGPDGPISTADILEFRLTQLDSDARAVLDRAAIVGEVFWEGTVVAMTRVEEGQGDPFAGDHAHARVSDCLRGLVAAELVSPIEESELALERQYSISVGGLRELLLRGQDEALRRARHDVCASWLELAAGPRADDLARAIAGHLERAGLTEAAGRAYLRAARAARASYRGPQAVKLFDKALALLAPGDAPARIDAHHDRGVVLSLLGRVDEATDAFVSMLSLAQRFGTRNKMAAALGRLGRLARGRGDLANGRDLLTRALDLFQQADDARGIAAVEDDLGLSAYMAGEFETALGHSTRALEIRRNLDDPLGEALSTHNLGLTHWARGQPRQARAHFERALALREKHGDVEGTATTRNVLAVLAFDRGEYDLAESIWSKLLELAEALGDKRMILIATHNLGEAAMRRGDVTRATEMLDAAELLCGDTGDKRALAEIERTRGTLARLAGDTERARPHLEHSLALARAMGSRESEALALRGLGEVCGVTVFDESGQLAAQAEQFFTEAVRILDELGATRELARTRGVFGQHLLERGDLVSARQMLTLAVPVLERLELAEAPAARAVLTRLGGELPTAPKPG